MIRQQDETIDTIAGTLNTLHEQAGLMGQEIGEHVEYVFVKRASPRSLPLTLHHWLGCSTTLNAGSITPKRNSVPPCARCATLFGRQRVRLPLLINA